MSARDSSPLAKPEDVFKVRHSTNASEVMILAVRSAKRWIPRTVITPDYTNQLDLFSDQPIDTEAAVAHAPGHVSGESDARPRPPEQLDLVALEPLPALDGRAAPPGEPVGVDAQLHGCADER